VRPANPFNPETDAVALKEAMAGIGADSSKIANILGKRTNAQRLQIAAKYKASYGKVFKVYIKFYGIFLFKIYHYLFVFKPKETKII
jgi:hypothetical protein